MRHLTLVERAFRALVVCRDHVTFDTRYLASAPGRRQKAAHLWMLVDGEISIAGQPGQQGPLLLPLRDDEFDRVVPSRSLTFRKFGKRVSFVVVRFPEKSVRVPVGLKHGPIIMNDDVAAAARALTVDLTNVEANSQHLVDLLECMGRQGLIDSRIHSTVRHEEPPNFVRLWKVLTDVLLTFSASPSFKQLADASGVSRRQLTRDVLEVALTFGAPVTTFKAASLMMRTRLAPLLLSVRGVTIGEVARALGYGSSDALGRAFREAGLPSPSEVQADLRRDRLETGVTA